MSWRATTLQFSVPQGMTKCTGTYFVGPIEMLGDEFHLFIEASFNILNGGG